ncbi:MAG TPA: GNAT family N-acetyltransferase [Candidatus Angelobacter sp.]|jgi:CelD/BcsL family acetyltransferase involved in cellulose biosynthesis|nr:GNAT family N-acetyltransferase [Candidatus Angelobacter sp.]
MDRAESAIPLSELAVTYNRNEIQFEVLRTLPAVEAIAGEWNRLLWSSPCNRAFSSPIWYLAACRTHPEFLPHVLTARRQGQLVGVLPLAFRPDEGKAVFPSLMSNYNDVIAEASDIAVTVGLLRQALSPPKPYSRLVIWWVPDVSNCMRALPVILAGRNSVECFKPTNPYYFLKLPSTYDDFLASRSRAFRKGVYRARRAAEQDGLELRQLDPASFPASDLPELFLTLNFARFGSESAFSEQPRNADFIRIALPVLFSQGQMAVFALLHKGEIVGIDLSMVGAESFCTWNGGYPPEVEQWSPGRLLIDAGIRRAFELSFKEYDFLRGMQEWKGSWANQQRTVGHIELPVGD